MALKRIVCTVTNDLNFDQRMFRICGSLAKNGFEVTLVGRLKSDSKPLTEKPFIQKRLFCFFQAGKFFYVEYNIRLFFYLFFKSFDVICAIDLDTILPCLWISKIKNKKRVYDAHELFCEMDEIVSRSKIYSLWKKIEQYAVPQFQNGYTIGDCYAEEFKNMYGVEYEIVRNATILKPLKAQTNQQEKYILYQGAVNEGRCFETLIPAMKHVHGNLIICGEGNFHEQAQHLTALHKLEDKITFKGYIEPQELIQYTQNAYIGITLFSNFGKSNYLSMANRFFDYMHHAVPQLAMNFPEYARTNSKFEIAILVDDSKEETISNALNKLLEDEALHARLKSNCLQAREYYCWQEEEKKLIHFYKKLLG